MKKKKKIDKNRPQSKSHYLLAWFLKVLPDTRAPESATFASYTILLLLYSWDDDVRKITIGACQRAREKSAHFSQTLYE